MTSKKTAEPFSRLKRELALQDGGGKTKNSGVTAGDVPAYIPKRVERRLELMGETTRTLFVGVFGILPSREVCQAENMAEYLNA